MADVRSRPKNRLSQKYLDSLIIKKEDEPETVVRPPMPVRSVLHSEEEYDTLHPEEQIKEFCAFIRQAISTYEYDKSQFSDYEAQMQDLLHYAEMGKDKDASKGYRIYKELCAVRRKRRACQNEMDLLQPIYDLFHNTKTLEQLTTIQGNCHNIKQTISNKAYTVRTDVLDQFI